MGPNPTTSVLIGRENTVKRHRENGPVKTKAETRGMQLLAKEWQGSHKKLGRGKGIIFL